jgi:phage baseplate assembly protein W
MPKGSRVMRCTYGSDPFALIDAPTICEGRTLLLTEHKSEICHLLTNMP